MAEVTTTTEALPAIPYLLCDGGMSSALHHARNAWPLLCGLGPLSATPTAPRLARAFTVMVLNDWGLTALAEDGELVTSELTANVIRAAIEPGERARRGDAGKFPVMCVRLLSDRVRLQVEVWDNIPAAQGVPALRHADPDDETGRGLGIVNEISLDWGWEHQPGEGFKRVWALLGT
jgi:anti-sigma regulatory factor (Ser/Thr protein kinase)